MTKKIFIHIAALGVVAMSAIGCQSVTDDNDKTDSDILAAPVVELPANVGVNPFKGKTFRDKENQYVFSSDGKTPALYHYGLWYDFDNGRFVLGLNYQYKYSVDTDKKELSWHMEKINIDDKLCSFEEYIASIKSGEYLKVYEAYCRERLDKGDITVDKFDEYLKNEKEWIDKEIASGFPDIKNTFTAINWYKYKYNEDEGTLDLVEQFEKSSATFSYNNNENFFSNELSLRWVEYYNDKGSNGSHIWFNKGNNSIYFDSKSVSDGKIIFVNEDDENDTFTARYELTGSGNDTKMQLSFTYDGKKFNPTLDFAPSERHLTEVK